MPNPHDSLTPSLQPTSQWHPLGRFVTIGDWFQSPTLAVNRWHESNMVFWNITILPFASDETLASTIHFYPSMLAWLILRPPVHSHDLYWLCKYCIIQWIMTLCYEWVIILTCLDMFKNNMITIPWNFTVTDVESVWLSICIATYSSVFFHKFTILLLSIHNSFTSTNIPTASTQPFYHNITSTSTHIHTHWQPLDVLFQWQTDWTYQQLTLHS